MEKVCLELLLLPISSRKEELEVILTYWLQDKLKAYLMQKAENLLILGHCLEMSLLTLDTKLFSS